MSRRRVVFQHRSELDGASMSRSSTQRALFRFRTTWHRTSTCMVVHVAACLESLSIDEATERCIAATNEAFFNLCHSLRPFPSAIKELQPLKASRPIWVTESGIVTLVKELQSRKADDPILVTEAGIVKLIKELQSQNERGSISVIESGIVKLVKELHRRKAHTPISVTEAGMVKVVKELQP